MPETARIPVPGIGGGEVKAHAKVLLVGAPPEQLGILGDDSERAKIWRAGLEVLEANSFEEANHHLDKQTPGEIQAILVNLVGIQAKSQAGNQVVSPAALEELQFLRGRVPFSALIVIVPGIAPELVEAVFGCGANDCLLGGLLKPEALARSLRFNIDRHRSAQSPTISRSGEALPLPVIPGNVNSGFIGYSSVPLRGVPPLSPTTPSSADGLSSAVMAGRPFRPLPRHAPPAHGVGTPPEKGSVNNPIQYGLLIEANERLKAEVAERRRSEHAMKEALEKAEAANLAKSEFLARISHEIRTPMNGIIGMTELVLDTELNARQREYLHLVSQSAESLLVLINDVLDFSKIEAGTLEIESRPFSLRDVLGDSVRSFGVAAASKGLELVLDIHAEVPAFMVGDAGRIRQVLINLIGNAVKFTDTGEVTVSVGLKGSDDESRFASIQVADTGIGIPARELGEIFEAFTQVDPSTTRRHSGTGLGLAITKSLVEQLGGALHVQSVEGKGSIFEFTLPILNGTAPESLKSTLQKAKGSEENPCDLKGLRALVLEAHPAACKGLVSILAQFGIVSHTVQDRTEAAAVLEAARRKGEAYDLVLVGSTLEGGTLDRVAGTRFCDAVSLGPEPRPSVILMLPPASSSVEVQRAWTYPSGLLLSKPVVASSLFEAIHESIRNKGNLSGHRTDTGVEEGFISDEFSTTPLATPKRKILVVEDNLISQRVAETILSNEGYLVTTAHNGRDAINALLHEPFDLVLMDLQMPEMDGLEATRSIRLLGHMRGRVPIVTTTAHALAGDRERCLEAGADHYLPKPFHKRELLEVVSMALKETPV